MTDEQDQQNLSSSSDDDDSTSSSSSTSTDDDDDDDDDEEQGEDESDDNLTSLTPKQAYLFLETKRKTLGKRLLELRDELKAQPQDDIETKKRLLTEIKNLREKWIAVQTRLTNVKARLSHSPTPEREVVRKPPVVQSPVKKPEEPIQPETRVIPPPRERTTSYSSSSRSRSSSRESSESNEKPYHDLDALDNIDDSKTRDLLSSRPTTSYRDLIDEESLSSSPPESPSQIPLTSLSPSESKILDTNNQEKQQPEEQEPISDTKDKFYNQAIPYPVVNDKRDLDLINRQLKNQLRELEAGKNNPLYNQSNVVYYERLKKQNEYINLRLRIEKLKRTRTKTQREKEQNKKQFHTLLQEFRKLQRFMRTANREYSNNQFFTINPDNFPSLIPLPPSPPPTTTQTEDKQQRKQQSSEDLQLPPLDLNRVTGKKIIFESSDEDEDEGSIAEPQVPVSLSASEPRAVPDDFIENQLPPLPIPSSSSSSSTLNDIKNRVANLIHPSSSSSTKVNEQTSKTQVVKNNDNDDEDDDDDDDDEKPVVNTERTQAVSAKFNRKRRKAKRNKNKKKNNNAQTAQQVNNENELGAIDQEEAWKRHIAMRLQFGAYKGSNPILRALTTEAYKRLGVNPDDINESQYDDEMDYETALILQQQEEFLAAAAANPFNVLHSAAVSNSSSRPNLVDVLSNLNGGITPSSSEPQTPMSLLQKFFLDANHNPNADSRKHFNDLSTTPPTPPSPRDISLGRKIVESLTHQDINALLKLSGSEHDDDDDDEDNNASLFGDTDDDTNNFSIDEDSNDVPNGNHNNKDYEQWVRPTPVPSRSTPSSSMTNKKSAIETLILPSFNRCTHLGKSTKRTAGVERMFPSFSKHNSGPSSTLSLILYGLSSTP